MYAKCGHIAKAIEAFDNMPKRNAFSWAALINGFAIHGMGKEAISYLNKMTSQDGIKPDGVVLLSVLSACSHAGMEQEGRVLLNAMETRYGIKPKHEHYSCVVDLLCRAGKLEEAFGFIQNIPMMPLSSAWGSLLSSSRIHANVKLAEVAAKKLVVLENVEGKKDDGVYVQLSNVYLRAGRSEDALAVRKMMGSKGIKKTPGCSVIEVDGMVNEFVAGDTVHPLRDQIYAMLKFLALNIVHHGQE